VLRLPRVTVVVALSLIAVALLGCGESSEEKAKAQVCSARSEISAQISKLEGLSISSTFLTEAKSSVEAINKSLAKIKEAEPNLEPAVKEQVEAGTKAFQSEMLAIGAGLVTAAKVGNLEAEIKTVGPQVKAALTQLSTTYKQAYASLKC
jgi:Tfp pilus assembly protein PilP